MATFPSIPTTNPETPLTPNVKLSDTRESPVPELTSNAYEGEDTLPSGGAMGNPFNGSAPLISRKRASKTVEEFSLKAM
jgi:hypothetical protein